MDSTGTPSPPERMDPTPFAAGDPRIYLAAERTMLAWIRTGLAMMGLGFLIAKHGVYMRDMTANVTGEAPDGSLPSSLWIGVVLLLLGVASVFLAALEHIHMAKRLRVIHQAGSVRFALATFIVFVLGLTGVGMIIHLLIS